MLHTAKKTEDSQNRKELLKVAKLGPKAFEQCAGFLQDHAAETIRWTAPAVHPESYAAAGKLAGVVSAIQKKTSQLESLNGISGKIRDYKKMAEELEIGEPTLRDIVRRTGKTGPRSA